MTYDKVSDDVLKQIAEGNGHAYRHEAKAMARELQEFRAARDAAAAPVPNPQHGSSSSPSPQQGSFPWGGIP